MRIAIVGCVILSRVCLCHGFCRPSAPPKSVAFAATFPATRPLYTALPTAARAKLWKGRSTRNGAEIASRTVPYDDVQQAPYPPTNVDRILQMLNSRQAKKLGVWVAFLSLVALLRSFYAVILGTFVLSYIGNSAVNLSMAKCNGLLSRSSLPVKRLPRRLYALAYTCMLLAAITTTTVLTVPRLNVESQFLASLGELENPYMALADWVRQNFGLDALNKLEPFLLSITGESGRKFAGYNLDYRELIASKLSNTDPWSPERNMKFAKLLQFLLSKYIKSALTACSAIVSQLTSVLYKAVLSLLFSLMVVWDLPGLCKAGPALRRSRLGFAYDTIGPQLIKFGKLLGQSFEVQFLIALCNTGLTTLGLLALGISGAWVLSFIVFICSFVPVAGVFLSTLPMVVAALGEYGVSKVFEVMIMVLLVHAVEAYLLNPQIYSAKLKLHPITILAVLYMTEHVVGVQGLIVAVPVAVFVLNNVLNIGQPAGEAEAEMLPESGLIHS
ncbi:hypothetical protein JKP88DRAFT_265686 [Tribonema minus]|uniref:Uncharacterized protein n=1 Tax=Tribonema minus TaxID=303371 RepID=A0A835YJQ5_9STRA|nr:hypothetical protein JKP88DRAFT_265686 [Tribonema minus]